MKLYQIYFLLFILLPSTSFAQKEDSIVNGNKFQVNFIKSNIVGSWKDQNSTLTFKKGGSYIIKYDNYKQVQKGSWKIKPGSLILIPGWMGPHINWTYTILYFSPSLMKIKENSNDTIWICNKIENRK